LLTLPAHHSDDLTVQVIFFGYGEKTGEILMNQEATAPAAEAELRAKL
jgi:pyruvate dehydrogenase phosphatase